MIQSVRTGLAVALAALLTSTICTADTWTDASGKFSIEAEYVRVDGRSVVLKKADGTTITVPIDKLSTESRAKAKELYQAARSGAAPAATAPAGTNMPANGIDISGGASDSATGSTGAFPANASLQQTVDHIRSQILAGHPEVVWYALPTSMRTAMDSDEVRSAMKPIVEQQSEASKPVEDLLKKFVDVLTKKKQFILNNNMVKSQVPPPMMPMIQQAYDPVVGILSEVIALQFAMQKVGDKTFTEVIDFHGPRIGGHMTALLPLAPPGAIDQVMGQIQVNEAGPNAGTVTVPAGNGTEVVDMVRYEDRWIPKELADWWAQSKDNPAQTIVDSMNLANQNPQAAQANAMVAMFAGQASQMMDPLLQANSQQEFDAAIGQLIGTAMAMGMGGAGGPGAFPGGPGGGFPPGGPGGPGGFPPGADGPDF